MSGDRSRPARPRRLEVFAVEDTSAQVCWAALPPGDHELRAGDAAVVVDDDAGAAPGARRLEGLAPGTGYDLLLDGRPVRRFTTLPALAGPPLARIATLSDIHIGERSFGYLPVHREPDATELHPVRCLRAALAELQAWGADLLVIKGDLADHNRAEEYEQAAIELKAVRIPMVVIPGNHDGANHREADMVACLGAHDIEVTTGVGVVDLPGVRVVAASTNHPHRHYGHVKPRLGAIAEALADAGGPCLLLLHHHVQRTIVPTHWPMGVWGWDGHRLLRTIERANPATLVSSGHTHRHRRRRHGPVVITEVGSPKDHPGVWGGYVAHADGIRQVVHRVAEPSAIAWTERTRSMLLGQWGRWSPGRLSDRCFVHHWPTA